MAQAFALPDERGGLEAIHLRHLAIHEDRFVGVARAGFDGLQAVAHRLRAVPEALDHGHRDLLVDRVVLDHEDAPSAPPVRVLGASGVRPREAYGEPEGAALPGLAAHADLAAHGRDDAAGQCESQPGPAETARGGPVRLHEGLEQARLRRGVDPDPGVGDLETEDRGRRVRSAHEAGPRHHRARRGELDRVAEEAEEHLAQPRAVSPQERRHLVRHHRGDMDALGRRFQRDGGAHLLDDATGLHVAVFQLEAAGFGAREVEDRVHHAQELAAGAPDDLGVLLLRRVQGGVEEQARHAQHAVEGRAQLVADVGQELGLDARGLLRRTSMSCATATTPATSAPGPRHGCTAQVTYTADPSGRSISCSAEETTGPSFRLRTSASAKAAGSESPCRRTGRDSAGSLQSWSHCSLWARSVPSPSRMAMGTGAWATTSRNWRRSRSTASSACLRRVMSRATAWKPTTFVPSVRSCTFWPIQISSPPRVTAMNSSYALLTRSRNCALRCASTRWR